jgi:hypothetical protein
LSIIVALMSFCQRIARVAHLENVLEYLDKIILKNEQEEQEPRQGKGQR